MRKLLIAGLLSLAGCSMSYASVLVNGGVGAVVSDNDNVESAAIGKVDVGYGIGKYISVGVSVGQTGTFRQNDVPQSIIHANANPQAYAGTSHHNVNNDTVIVNNNNTEINVNVIQTPDPLPKRPIDTTERNFWTAESFLEIGLPLGIIRPYGKAFLGASGVKSYDNDSRVGVSKGLGAGLSVNLFGLSLGVEAIRRHIETSVNTYGNWQYIGTIGLNF